MEETSLSFTHNDYEVTKCDELYQGFFRMVKKYIRHKKFDGSWTREFDREIVERPSAVGVLPYDPKLDQVVLIEQFRAGAMSSTSSPWLIEIIAGIYREDDDPMQTLHNEAQEEGGLLLLDLEQITEYFVSPGGNDEYFTLFCGRVDASQAGGIFGLDEENEDIRAFAVPVAEAINMMQQGLIKTAPAIIALQWLQLNHEKLKQLWLK